MAMATTLHCSSHQKVRPIGPVISPSPQDAPFLLADNVDLPYQRSRFLAATFLGETTPVSRKSLADEYARRISHHLDQKDYDKAHGELVNLATLWQFSQRTPNSISEFSSYLPLIQTALRHFSRTGLDTYALTTIAVLYAASPEETSRSSLWQQVTDIEMYLDGLDVAEVGHFAKHARFIKQLSAAIAVAPSPTLSKLLLNRLLQRQALVTDYFRKPGRSTDTLTSQIDVLYTTVHGLQVLIRLGALRVPPTQSEHIPSIDFAEQWLAQLQGLGTSAELIRLYQTARRHPTPQTWIALAKALLGNETEAPDPRVSLLVSGIGLSQFPNNEGLLFFIARLTTNGDNDNYQIATDLIHKLWQNNPDNPIALSVLLKLYTQEISFLSATDRPSAAKKELADLHTIVHSANTSMTPIKKKQQMALTYMNIGIGMISNGRLHQGKEYLQRSHLANPSKRSSLALAKLAYAMREWETSVSVAQQGLAVPWQDSSNDTHNSPFLDVQLLTILGKVFDRTTNSENRNADKGKAKNAAHKSASIAWFEQAHRTWKKASRQSSLPRKYTVSTTSDYAYVLWKLGKRKQSIRLWQALTKNNPATAASSLAVSFFLQQNQYDEALDIFSSSIAHPKVDDYYKLYMCLWIKGYTQRHGQEEAPTVVRYLQTRPKASSLWQDTLAHFALGTITSTDLLAKANTAAQQVEATFYVATLGPLSRKSKEYAERMMQVASSSFVRFFEFKTAQAELTFLKYPIPPVRYGTKHR